MHSTAALPLRLGARAWAAVSVSFSRTDLCLWAPSPVIGLAAAAVAAAAADDDEAGEEEEQMEEEEEEDADEEERASSRLSSSFSAAASRWFSSLDVDLDCVAEVAAEMCYAAGVEARIKEGGGTSGSRNRVRGGASRADAVARVFAFLKSGGKGGG